MTSNDLIASNYRMAKVLLHRMVDDLTPADFAHQPVMGTNSAGWIVGHLAMTLRRTAERLGVSDLPAVSPALVSQFAQTGKPAENQAMIGLNAEMVKLFDECCDAVIEAVKRVPADKLAGPPPHPGPPLATNFGEQLLFGGLHIATHIGQISTIRRSRGKPPIV